MFSSFLTFCCYFNQPKPREVSWKIWETLKNIALLYSALCVNKYVLECFFSNILHLDYRPEKVKTLSKNLIRAKMIEILILQWFSSCWNDLNRFKHRNFSIGLISNSYFYGAHEFRMDITNQLFFSVSSQKNENKD